MRWLQATVVERCGRGLGRSCTRVRRLISGTARRRRIGSSYGIGLPAGIASKIELTSSGIVCTVPPIEPGATRCFVGSSKYTSELPERLTSSAVGLDTACRIPAGLSNAAQGVAPTPGTESDQAQQDLEHPHLVERAWIRNQRQRGSVMGARSGFSKSALIFSYHWGMFEL